jgi:hypothetical protein
MLPSSIKDREYGKFMDDGSGNTAIRAVVVATNGLQLPNVSAPPATPVGGGVLYVETGSLKYKGSSGTVTSLAAA